ncbi:hypothetical protein [Natronomonas sp. EA1]|uniref:hypothetical protein n=1 Tax=Natronomonas sp. EA1 TaxID=3421655 RepID=UPI003EBF555B
MTTDVTVENPGSGQETFTVATYTETGSVASAGSTPVETVTLAAGDTRTVSLSSGFYYAREDASLRVNGQSPMTGDVLPQISIDSGSVTPTDATVGEALTVEVTGTNHGSSDTSRFVEVGTVDSQGQFVRKATIDLVVPAASTASASTTVSFAGEGSYALQTRSGVTVGTVDVTNPLTMSGIVPPSTVYTQIPQGYDVTVKNPTASEVTAPVALQNGRGQTIGSKSVTVAAESSKTVTVDAVLMSTYTETVTAGAASASVSPEAPVSVDSLSLSSESVAIGEQVAVTATVTNKVQAGDYVVSGNSQPSYNSLSKTVSFSAQGETKDVSFTTAFDYAGRGSITIGQQSASVDVTSPLDVTGVTTPETVYAGVAHAYEVLVTNPTSSEVTVPVAFQDQNNRIVGEKSVTLAADASKTVTVDVTLDSARTQLLHVNGQSVLVSPVSPISVQDISLSANSVGIGEQATVSVTATNNGPAGTYTLSGQVSPTMSYTSLRKDVSFAAGETKTVTFTTSFPIAGEGTVEFGSASATATVASSLTATDLSIPTEPVTRTETAVSVTLKNPTSSEVTETVAVVDEYGRVLGSTSATVTASQTTSVEIPTTFSSDYEQAVSVLGQSATVDPVPALTVTDLTAPSSAVTPGEAITFTATVTNQNGPAKAYRLSGFGGPFASYASKTVSLSKGETKQVTFTTDFGIAGTGTFTVGDATQSVEVTSPLTVSDISFPDTVVAKEDTTAQITLSNPTSSAVAEPVAVLDENGNVLTSIRVSLAAGETKMVDVTLRFDHGYQRTVSVLGESLVVSPQSPLRVDSVSPASETVTAGEPVTFTATVTNTASKKATFDLYGSNYENSDSSQKSVTLSAGETKTVSFTTTFSLAGEREYAVESTSASVTVENPVSVTDVSYDGSADVESPETFTLTVENTGETAGTYPVTLREKYGETFAQTDVTLAAGEKKTITLDATFPNGRFYDLVANDYTDLGVSVNNPVTVTDYSISPSTAYVDEEVSVTATVKNTGETGTYPVSITDHQRELVSKEVTLAAGETTTVTLTTAFRDRVEKGSQWGPELNGQLLETLAVKQRIVEESVTVNDGVEVGEDVSLEVTYTNPTDKTATTYEDISLGATYAARQLTLAPGESKTITITGSFDEPGRHYHFLNTRYVQLHVFEDATGTADLQLPDQPIPSRLVVDKQSYIPVQVENVGDAAGVREVTISVDGKEVATKRIAAEPGETGSAGFFHTFTTTGTHEISIDGEQTVSVEVTSPVVTQTTVEHVSGPVPTTTPDIATGIGPYGGVYLTLKTPNNRVELTKIGATSETKFRVTAVLSDYAARTLVTNGRNPTFTTEYLGDGRTRVSTVLSPSDLNFRTDAPRLENWNRGNDTADIGLSAVAYVKVGDGTTGAIETSPEALSGLTISTNAQRFRQPQYEPGTSETPPSISVQLAGPHETVDGEIHQGYYKTFIPNSLLQAWDVSDPSQLAVTYKGDSASYTVTEVTGGLRVNVSLTYSTGTVTLARSSPITSTSDSRSDSSNTQTDDTSSRTSSVDSTTTPTATPTPTPTATPTATATPTPESTAPPTPAPSPTETVAPTSTPTPTATGPSATPTQAATPTSTGQPGYTLTASVLVLLALALLVRRD